MNGGLTVGDLEQRKADKGRLDWIESHFYEIGMIEPPEAFSDRKWTIWKNESDEHLGRGKTFREAIDQASTRL